VLQHTRGLASLLDAHFEFATFFFRRHPRRAYSYILRWVGGNEDPEYSSTSVIGEISQTWRQSYFLRQPRVDALIDQARGELDQNARKQIYAEIQRILADDLPYIKCGT